MADDYEKNRAFGKPENIEKRLAMWARQFSMDKSYPWVGLGLIDDLKCACRMLGGDPDKVYPDLRPKTIYDKPAPAPEVVYDL
jgi:hypothetical protein